MQEIGISVVGVVFGECDFGVDVVTMAPGVSESLEEGAIVEPGVGQAGVEAAHLDGLGTRRGPRPREQFPGGGFGPVLGEGAGGMAGPRGKLIRRILPGWGMVGV